MATKTKTRTYSEIGKANVEKGKRIERLWCKECAKYGYKVKRTRQASAKDDDDCKGLLGIWEEVKGDQTINIQKAMQQAVRDYGNWYFNHPNDVRIPIIALKRDYQPWKIIIRLPDLSILYGSECKRDLFMILVELSSEHFFKVYSLWRENQNANP